MATVSNAIHSDMQARVLSVAGKRIWAGRILTFVPALFLLFDAVLKLVKPAFVVEATVRLGYPERVIPGLGILLLTCTLIYLIPRTAVLGALLLMSYLGGAVATHVRAEQGWFEILFPMFIGMLLWGGLFLRDERARTLISLQRK